MGYNMVAQQSLGYNSSSIYTHLGGTCVVAAFASWLRLPPGCACLLAALASFGACLLAALASGYNKKAVGNDETD